MPAWVNSDDEPDVEPITHILCPCCKGEVEGDERRCLTSAEVLTRELAAFLGHGDIPQAGVTGWANQGWEAANTPGCYRCGDSATVPVDQYTEEVL